MRTTPRSVQFSLSTSCLTGLLGIAYQLWVGKPARYVRDLTTEEQIWMRDMAVKYVSTASTHASEFCLPYAMDAVHEAEQLRYTIGYKEDM
jgi:hypothetical protein